VAQQEDPQNFLIMHAMVPNVAGVIGSAVAAGVLLATFRRTVVEHEGAIQMIQSAAQTFMAMFA
jgi:acetyl-CoA carboxylase carboxyltransferase component